MPFVCCDSQNVVRKLCTKRRIVGLPVLGSMRRPPFLNGSLDSSQIRQTARDLSSAGARKLLFDPFVRSISIVRARLNVDPACYTGRWLSSAELRRPYADHERDHLSSRKHADRLSWKLARHPPNFKYIERAVSKRQSTHGTQC